MENTFIICWSRRDTPEIPPGSRSADLAKQQRFHAYRSDAIITMITRKY